MLTFLFAVNGADKGAEKLGRLKFLEDEAAFRLAMFHDQPATDKLDEAIRIFLDAGKETSQILRTKMMSL